MRTFACLKSRESKKCRDEGGGGDGRAKEEGSAGNLGNEGMRILGGLETTRNPVPKRHGWRGWSCALAGTVRPVPYKL
jgi:hypothetical protein